MKSHPGVAAVGAHQVSQLALVELVRYLGWMRAANRCVRSG